MKLVTAADIKQQVKYMTSCEGIDDWIDKIVRPRFIRNSGKEITVDQSAVSWPGQAFEGAMISRGFGVELKCEDRPCSYPYYVISL